VNVFCFTGNLGGDAETRYTQGGDAVVSFSVACKAGYGDKATTSWIRCSMFGKRVEAVSPYLTKGALVGVSGEFSAREWNDKDGQKRTSLEVRVNDLTLLGGKPEGKKEEAPRKDKPKPTFDDLDSDCPF